jgi:hypothetical protein
MNACSANALMCQRFSTFRASSSFPSNSTQWCSLADSNREEIAQSRGKARGCRKEKPQRPDLALMQNYRLSTDLVLVCIWLPYQGEDCYHATHWALTVALQPHESVECSQMVLYKKLLFRDLLQPEVRQ